MKTLTVKQIFEKENRPYNKDGRNRAHRALQGLLDTGLVTFSVCEPKKVWVSKKGFKYNVRVTLKRAEGIFYNQYFKSTITNIDAYDVLKLIGITLQQEEVRAFMNSYVDVDSTCKKCNGQGIISYYHYYCNGVCFDCYGLGHNPKHRHIVELHT